ncbi:hypothetical protein CLV62_1173 [Dysgonomonas alginatilytica]|uniref:Dolichyl-phosphate-mannose-protein mannosyltransferase n=1 Tax=Dysgonomonas alginatilytica TaxID=1605892 RepID=A0A2V3PNL9_9BACT|nr:hypothetical protein [Dysgonomonas alginatilytica]PXV62787.1 hypothetical protein CLV62_1173 [Dysgonomonas alginatilytica]
MTKRQIFDNNTQKVLLFILVIINMLFVVKYCPAYSFYVSAIYGIALFSSYCFYKYFLQEELNKKRYSYILLAIIICIAISLLLLIDPYNVTVDRWSALYNWSDTLFQGKYPYYTYTHVTGNYPSPFPVWQVLHIPFYFLGEMGVGHLVTLALVSFVLFTYRKEFNLTLFLFLLLLSPCYWWEIAVRSDLMNNMFICLLFITIFHFSFRNTKYLIPLGLIIGLLLCTRLFTGIPLAIYFIPYFFRKNKIEKLKLITGCLLGFVCPFIPLMIWDFDMLFFFEYSPLILQTKQGSIYTLMAGLVFISIFSFCWKSYKEYLLYISIILFSFIFLSFIKFLYLDGFMETLTNDLFDISYFNITIPFVVLGLCLSKTDKNENKKISLFNK